MSTPSRKPKEGTVQQLTPYQRWLENVITRAELEEGGTSGADIAERVLGNILEADSLEAAFAAQDNGLPNGKDMVDVEMRVTDFQIVKSDTTQYDAGLPVYMRINAMNLETGEAIQFATGASNVVMLLHKAELLEALPLDCRIQAKETGNGGTLLTLRRLAKRAI